MPKAKGQVSEDGWGKNAGDGLEGLLVACTTGVCFNIPALYVAFLNPDSILGWHTYKSKIQSGKKLKTFSLAVQLSFMDWPSARP